MSTTFYLPTTIFVDGADKLLFLLQKWETVVVQMLLIDDFHSHHLFSSDRAD